MSFSPYISLGRYGWDISSAPLWKSEFFDGDVHPELVSSYMSSCPLGSGEVVQVSGLFDAIQLPVA
jgi:hypothetical protein